MEFTPSSPDLGEVIGDLDWVLHQLADALSTTPSPTLDTSGTPRNKRQVVLTEKAMAAGENVHKRFRRE